MLYTLPLEIDMHFLFLFQLRNTVFFVTLYDKYYSTTASLVFFSRRFSREKSRL